MAVLFIEILRGVMKRVIEALISVILMVLLGPGHLLSEGGDEVVSLSDCIQKALADNPSLTLAQDDVSISRARQRAATVSLLPRLER
jgi:hypothetical protein